MALSVTKIDFNPKNRSVLKLLRRSIAIFFVLNPARKIVFFLKGQENYVL